ncbi:MAG: hypothetical protein ACREXP_07510 [Steroidobacteraceae bacterium]
MGAVIAAVSKYRVDNVPLLLQPLFMLFGYGVGHIAVQSGAPIVPLRFTLSRALKLPTWDRERLPLPFSTITVRFGAPIFVDESNFDDAIRATAEQL